VTSVMPRPIRRASPFVSNFAADLRPGASPFGHRYGEATN
jgi:hypothetical protein